MLFDTFMAFAVWLIGGAALVPLTLRALARLNQRRFGRGDDRSFQAWRER